MLAAQAYHDGDATFRGVDVQSLSNGYVSHQGTPLPHASKSRLEGVKKLNLTEEEEEDGAPSQDKPQAPSWARPTSTMTITLSSVCTFF